MNVYEKKNIGEFIKENPYVGRGIVIGKTGDGEKAAIAYFIMGRSDNSRNRVFVEKDEGLMIKPFDESKIEDPSLIIYWPVRSIGRTLIVTNGDQTDTIYQHISKGSSFVSALDEREFEPDAPNFTPRISGIIDELKENFTYQISILKSLNLKGEDCARYYFKYPSQQGIGHFIHTYECDGNPLPTFYGEPKTVEIPDSIDELTDDIWQNLNNENKISLYTRYVDLRTGFSESRVINKNL